MCPDDSGSESFEDKMRTLARELSRSFERVAQFDIEEIASAIGVDPARASEWMETAVGWVRSQAEGFAEETPGWDPESSPTAPTAPADEPRKPGPHPLDLPTQKQGLALAALDSGRWKVEPGSHSLAGQGEGPGPSDKLGLVGELRARDWIGADGELTLVGRHALSRWLEADSPS